jgi:hypothetical protein
MKRRRIVIAGKDGLFKWAIWPEYRAPEYTRLINWNWSNMHLVLVYHRMALVVAGPLQVYTRSQ